MSTEVAGHVYIRNSFVHCDCRIRLMKPVRADSSPCGIVGPHENVQIAVVHAGRQ